MTKKNIRNILEIEFNRQTSESPMEKITIAKICRSAKINRCNIYQNHPDFIEMVKNYNQTKETRSIKQGAKPTINKSTELTRLRNQLKIATYTILELKIALEHERKKSAGK